MAFGDAMELSFAGRIGMLEIVDGAVAARCEDIIALVHHGADALEVAGVFAYRNQMPAFRPTIKAEARSESASVAVLPKNPAPRSPVVLPRTPMEATT